MHRCLEQRAQAYCAPEFSHGARPWNTKQFAGWPCSLPRTLQALYLLCIRSQCQPPLTKLSEHPQNSTHESQGSSRIHRATQRNLRDSLPRRRAAGGGGTSRPSLASRQEALLLCILMPREQGSLCQVEPLDTMGRQRGGGLSLGRREPVFLLSGPNPVRVGEG